MKTLTSIEAENELYYLSQEMEIVQEEINHLEELRDEAQYNADDCAIPERCGGRGAFHLINDYLKQKQRFQVMINEKTSRMERLEAEAEKLRDVLDF